MTAPAVFILLSCTPDLIPEPPPMMSRKYTQSMTLRLAYTHTSRSGIH